MEQPLSLLTQDDFRASPCSSAHHPTQSIPHSTLLMLGLATPLAGSPLLHSTWNASQIQPCHPAGSVPATSFRKPSWMSLPFM